MAPQLVGSGSVQIIFPILYSLHPLFWLFSGQDSGSIESRELKAFTISDCFSQDSYSIESRSESLFPHQLIQNKG